MLGGSDPSSRPLILMKLLINLGAVASCFMIPPVLMKVCLSLKIVLSHYHTTEYSHGIIKHLELKYSWYCAYRCVHVYSQYRIWMIHEDDLWSENESMY